MQPFNLRTGLTLADWQALQRVSALRLQQHGRAVQAWRVVALWFAIAFASYALIDVLDVELNLLSFVVGVAFCAVIVLAAQKRSWRAARPREGGPFLSPCEHEFSAEGISSTQPGARSFTQWQRVIDVTATSEHILVWIDTLAAYVIPVRDLPEGMTAEQVIAGFKEWMAAAPVEQAAVPAEPLRVGVAKPAWRTVLRLITLRDAGRADHALSGKLASIVRLALFSLALWMGLSWFYYVPEPQFYPYGIPALAFYVLAALTVAVAMAKRSHPQIALARVCTLLAILLPVLIVAEFVIVMWIPEQWGSVTRVAVALYALVFCARGLHALTGTRQPAAALGGLGIAVAFVWSASALYVYPALWTGKDDYDHEAEIAAAHETGEVLLFEQSARIDASVAQLEEPAGTAPAGYFVGFAGYGEQRVFAEEIKFAARIFAERYDTAARTLLLINDRRDRDAQPLATVSGLSYALKAVAARMRTEEDVLFLALSSHGSEDPLLSVSNGALPLRDLTGEALAEALRESGIKWRVIVISACHSGAFIEPLRDPNTIVITAAAPDRSSFGCSDDRDMTYFGEAFFRDSLPQAASLQDAFHTATKLVSERERAEGFEPSQPQAFFGESIEQRLESMSGAGVGSP
jgi:hypothetical protein